MSTVFSKVKKNIEDFENGQVVITDGYDFSQKDTLRKIDLYYASRFLTGDRDRRGFKKLFFNIVKSRTNTATKNIDIDLKDIGIDAGEGESYFVAWFFEAELREFMREHGFSKLFNQIADRVPRYGSVVVKDVNGKPELVSLKNLVLDQTVENITDSPYVDEHHIMSFEELEEMNGKWKNTDKAVKLYQELGESQVKIVEHYGWFHGDELLDYENDFDISGVDKDDFVKARIITAGMELFDDENDDDNTIEPIVLDASVWDDKWPYKDFHWDKEEGRWLGIGTVEDLFEAQEAINETRHLQRKDMYWASKKLYQSADDGVPDNLFVGADDGDVLESDGGVSPIVTESRNLPAYGDDINRLEKNADERTFSFEVTTGESLPSGTPFRQAAILANAVNTHFARKREDFGIFIKEIITDFIIPEFKKKKRKKHKFGFTGKREQLEKAQELLIATHMRKAMDEFEEENGRLPSLEEFDRELARVSEKVRSRDKAFVTLPDNFYDDLESKVDIIITGEEKNVGQEIETLTNLFTVLAQSGAPQAQEVLNKIMDLAGQSPVDFGLLGQQQPQQQPARQQSPQAQTQSNTQAFEQLAQPEGEQQV